MYNIPYLCIVVRKIVAYGRYYSDFMKSLSDQERLKIQRALLLFSTNDRVPSHYIKYLKEGIYEFRVTYGHSEFRIFFCYDGDKLVILFNGLRKKTTKTPQTELKRAIKLKEEYYAEKEK